jgi:hypothetical protein
MVPPLRGRDEESSSDASYGPHTTLRGEHLTNSAKSVIRVRSESGHRTSFVGHPDGDDAGDERRDAFEAFLIAVYRASSFISWDVEAL